MEQWLWYHLPYIFLSLLKLSLLCYLYLRHQSVMFKRAHWRVPGTCSPAPGWSSIPVVQRAPRAQPHPLLTLCLPVLLWGRRVAAVASPCLGGSNPCCTGAAVPITTVAACSSPGALWHLSPLLCKCPWCWPGLVPTLAGWQPLQVLLETWLQVRPTSGSLHLISLMETAHWQLNYLSSGNWSCRDPDFLGFSCSLLLQGVFVQKGGSWAAPVALRGLPCHEIDLSEDMQVFF